MSNLLVSFVKTYNWKYKRKGVLFDGRYRRHIIESEKELTAMNVLLKSGDYCFKTVESRKRKRRIKRGKSKVGIEGIEVNKRLFN
jgi:hypothetical protein